MQLINLIKNPIDVRGNNGIIHRFDPHPMRPRLPNVERLMHIDEALGIHFYERIYSDIIGLPPVSEDTLYIVNTLIAYVANRPDFVTPVADHASPGILHGLSFVQR